MKSRSFARRPSVGALQVGASAWLLSVAACTSARQLAVERAEAPPVVAAAPATPANEPEANSAARAVLTPDSFALQLRAERLMAEARLEPQPAAAAAAPAASRRGSELTQSPPPILVPPSLVTRVEPEYPTLSRRLGEEGVVTVRIDVADDGVVSAVEVLATSGFARLDQSARAAILKWRFAPATRNDRPIPWPIEHRVSFRLEDAR